MLETHEQHAKTKLIATVLFVIVIAGCVVFADQINGNKTSGSTTATSTPTTAVATDTTSTPTANTTTASSSTATSSSGLKDGSYSASASYYVPHGNEHIDVKLTLAGGVVSDVSITNSEGDHESAQYQEDFASVYKSYVVGKKITDLRLGIIAGASDTSQGFSDALSQITAKAQA